MKPYYRSMAAQAAERRARHLRESDGYARVPVEETEEVERTRNARPPLTDPQQMTDRERKALRACTGKGGAPLDKVRGSVRTRLLDAGWVTVGEVVLVTKAGRAALGEPQRLEDVPVFLKQRDGLTTQPSRAVPGEPEVLTADPRWQRRAEEKRVADQDAKAEATAAKARARRAA